MVAEVVSEMDYLRAREQKLRDTNESTNNRVKWFGMGTTFLLIALWGWQIMYLRAYFRFVSPIYLAGQMMFNCILTRTQPDPSILFNGLGTTYNDDPQLPLSQLPYLLYGFMVTTGGRFYELFTTRNAGERMGYNRLEISGVNIYGNVFRPKSYGVKRRTSCMLSEPSNLRLTARS